MKKRLKYLVVLTFTISFVLLGFVIPTSMHEKLGQNVSFDSFSKSYINLIKNHDKTNFKEMTFDLENDGYYENDTYMVSGSTFEKVTGSTIDTSTPSTVKICGNNSSVTLADDENIIRENDDIDVMSNSIVMTDDEVYFPLENIAKSLGFSLKYDSNKLSLYNPYQTKRLIIKSYSKLDSKGAIACAEGYDGLHIYQYATEDSTIEAYNYYKSLDDIILVELDSIVTTIDDEVTLTGVNDTFSYKTWGAEAMGVKNYSNYLINTVGKNNLPEIVVAVLDTGLDSDHTWFQNRIASGGKNFSTSTSSTSYEWEDVKGHGTHVSGTVVDLTLSNVKILPVKVMNDEGIGYQSSILLGIEYVIELKNNGMNICAMNMSLGSYCDVGSEEQTSYTTALGNAYSNNILTVVAAGNDGVDVATHTPSNVDIAITVSAVGTHGSSSYYRPSWSNYGSYIDVCAPGNEIISAYPGGGLAYSSGTSMASPHIAGIIALLYSDSAKNYSKTDIESMLDANTIDLGTAGWDEYFGEGLVNIEYAFAEQLDDVEFSKTTSDCTEAFQLTLSNKNPTAVIYYTTDGSIPSLTNGTKYKNPITISKTQQIKAIAYVLDANNNIIASSQVSSIVYQFSGTDVEDAFTVDENGILTSYNGVLTVVTVPSIVNNITIVAIGSNAFTAKSITSVTLPDTVTTIKSQAFSGCATLASIYAPAVKVIDMYAFLNCTSMLYLTDDYFPELISIGKYAFAGCYNITSINLSKVQLVDYYAFYMDKHGNTNLKSITLPKVLTIGEMAFFNCSNVTEINLESVQTICNGAFRECDITNLSLPSVKYIGAYSFYVNENLLTVDMPEVLIIGSSSFYYYATKLHTLNIPKAQIVGSMAFRMCTALSNINMPSIVEVAQWAFNETKITNLDAPKLKHIGRNSFGSCKLTTLNIPSVVDIGYYSFASNSNLQSVYLSSCIESINSDAFSSSTTSPTFYIYGGTVAKSYVTSQNFTYVELDNESDFEYTISNGEAYITGYHSSNTEDIIVPSYLEGYPVTKICTNAFSNNLYIKTLRMSYLKEIESGAFKNCSNLENITLDRVEIIRSSAFEGCTNLNEVSISNIKTIESKAFYGTENLQEIKIGKNITSIGDKALGYNNDDKIKEGFVLYGYDNTVAKAYATNHGITFRAIFNNITSYYYNTYTNNGVEEICITFVDRQMSGNIIIPSSHNGKTISKISSQAFENCFLITGISLPETIHTLEDRAFYQCENLQTINLENVKEIGENCFCCCEALTYISAPQIETVSKNAFSSCERLIEVDLPKVKTIRDNAFYGCRLLKRVNSPLVEEINFAAFCYDRSLEYIDTQNLRTLGTVNSNDIITGSVFSYVPITALYLPKIETLGNDILPTYANKVVIGKNFKTYYSSGSFNKSVTIYGYNNTLAKTYASTFGNPFVAINELGISIDLSSNIEVNQNESASLSIVATGFEQTYQWYECDSNTFDGVAITGETSPTLTLNTSTIGTKYYYVIVTDWDKSTITSNICKVDVLGGKNAKYKITASTSGSGTISNVGTTFILVGESIKYTFTPTSGYHVKSIIVDGTPLSVEELIEAIKNGYTFDNVNSNHEIVVTFAVNTYFITVIEAENGTISEALEAYDYGSSAEFIITPSVGYEVEYLIIDGEIYTKTLTSYIFTNIDKDHTISASFKITTYQIVATCSGSGVISPAGTTSFNYGDSVKYLFSPDIGSEVKDVKVDGVSVGVTREFVFSNISSHHSIYVEFQIMTFKVTVTIEGKGRIDSGDVDLNYVTFGKTVLLEILNDENWKLSEIYVDNQSVDISDVLELKRVTRDMEVKIVFTELPKPIEPPSPTLLLIILVVFVLFIVTIAVVILRRSSDRRL